MELWILHGVWFFTHQGITILQVEIVDVSSVLVLSDTLLKANFWVDLLLLA